MIISWFAFRRELVTCCWNWTQKGKSRSRREESTTWRKWRKLHTIENKLVSTTSLRKWEDEKLKKTRCCEKTTLLACVSGKILLDTGMITELLMTEECCSDHLQGSFKNIYTKSRPFFEEAPCRFCVQYWVWKFWIFTDFFASRDRPWQNVFSSRKSLLNAKQKKIA